MLPRAKSRSEPDDHELFDLRAHPPESTAADGEVISSDFNSGESDYGTFSEDNGFIPPRMELHEANLALPRSSRQDSKCAAAPQPYQTWALVLGSLVVFAAVGLLLMIGYRIGLLRSDQGRVRRDAEIIAGDLPGPRPEAAALAVRRRENPVHVAGTAKRPKLTNATPNAPDELVIYEKGKIIFRMKPTPGAGSTASARRSASGNELSSIGGSDAASGVALKTPAFESGETTSPVVWLEASEAERRLIERVEPEYPPDARAAHRAGNVSLELQVDREGRVSLVRTIVGDPLLAAAAARAVRNWRYQPYRKGDRPTAFQTEVTLTFSLPQ